MITINKPFIEKREQETFLLSHIYDEVRQQDFEVWYSVANEYGGYLCDEVADSFLLLTLQLAMKTGQDIRVEAPVSARLLFNIENTIQPVFAKAFSDHKHIKVMAQAASDIVYGGKGVGCCCSLGVDSFSSFLKHYSDDVVPGYRVTHLTLFNSGQLGCSDMEGSERSFRDSVRNLQSFADEVNLPIVAVNTNLNALFANSGLTLLRSFVDRTLSCAMALQRLFGKYVFSSSYSLEYFEMSDIDESHMESTFVPQMSTNSMEIVLSNPAMTRVEKTDFLSQFPITTRYLDVCWATQMANGDWKDLGTKLLEDKKHKNCGRCGKCMRTMLTLDLLGRLQQYEGQFDMDNYRARKERFVARVFAGKGDNVMYREIAEVMCRQGYKPSLLMWCRIVWIRCFALIIRVYSVLKKAFKKS